MEKLEGIIIKGIGGFYYVEVADNIYECKARGIFRKNKISPLAGDRVYITVAEDSENTIDEIKPRVTVLNRPPVANIDRLFIVSSLASPTPNTLVIDKMTAIAEKNNIEVIIVFTKSDLEDYSEYENIYTNAGFKTIITSVEDSKGVEEIKSLLKGHISAFAGNSGVGKSTLLNMISPELSLKTGEISDKLGRGRHTTRHVELYKICGGYIADTPGFSSIDIENSELILKDDLPYCFKEFKDYLGECKFSTCSHTVDKGCKIIEAVEKGIISKSRHESYCTLFEQVKNIKEWELS